MYERHFTLDRRPFSLLPDPDFLFLSRQHDMALTLLRYGLESQAGICSVTGRIGCGKTTLLRRLLEMLPQELTVGLITNTHESFGDLLSWTLGAFDLSHEGADPVARYRRFTDFLLAEYAAGRRVVLVVDEAQNLGTSALEQLRMLTNLNADKHQVLQLVLVGQPQLLELLRRPELAQFAQRVAVDYYIDALDEGETLGYVRHRLQVAGGVPGLFTPDAVAAVHEASGGVPRVINILCDTALVYAYATGASGVDRDVVADVVRDRQASGRLWQPAVAARDSVAVTPVADLRAGGGRRGD